MESFGTVLLHSLPEWLEFLFLAFCTGAVVCRLWVLDEAADGGAGRETLWRFFAISAGAVAVCSCADLLLRAAGMAALPLNSTLPLLPTVILRTHLGQVWLILIASVLVMLAALLIGWRWRESRPFSFFLLALLLVALLAKSASGHAADAGDFTLPEMIDWLHAVAASFWAGGLFVLSVLILPMLRDLPDSNRTTRSAGRRFSRIAAIAAGAVALTATYNACRLVGSARGMVEAPYGWIVMAKMALFLLVICLGALHRYVLLPLLEVASGTSAEKTVTGGLRLRVAGAIKEGGAREWFAHSVRWEAVAMILLLLCGALLRHEDPARHYLHQKGSPPGAHHHTR